MMHLERYKRKFKELIQLERREQMLLYRKEIKSLDGRKRERLGRALLHMKCVKAERGLGGRKVLKFIKKSGEKLPETEISVGDLVIISRKDPLAKDSEIGTVSEKTSRALKIAFDREPKSWILAKEVRIDLYVNDITFQRMLEALDRLEKLNEENPELLGVILGYKKPEFESLPKIKFFNEKLNKSQRIAVKKALAAKHLFLIHGPPGTGKTVTCTEIILQHVSRGYKVLATSDSNTAVDNLLENLINSRAKVVRIGHPARISRKLRKYSLDYLIENSKIGERYMKLKAEIEALIKERDKYLYPSMKWRRGCSYSQILKLAKKGLGFRGVSAKKVKSMAKWISLQEKIKEMTKALKEEEEKLMETILNDCDVICATNSTCGIDILKRMKFDLVVIDEATQATEPSCLIPITLAKKVILAGDHKQLPPTVLSQEAKNKSLEKSLFERLLQIYNGTIAEMLDVQYRMNETIMKFPSQEFYDSKLKASKLVKNKTLKSLKCVKSEERTKPIVFIDTSAIKHLEKSRRGSTSKENPLEVELVFKIVSKLLNLGVREEHIGVISPYDDQVDLLRKKAAELKLMELEIKTVDGFQGREKEVIIVSFVRSNPKQEIGFLKDLRRLNVAITRAKKKLILIGNSKTLSKNKVYERLITYIKKNGSYISANEEIVI